MSLIEASLCPLRAKAGSPLVHRSSFWYYDKNNHRKQATTVVKAMDGLCPNDELFLWVLLSIAFQQESPRFFLTQNFILRTMGMVDSSRGRPVPNGAHYKTLKAALKRLSQAHYSCDKFYDPIRGEHREASFNFVSYTKPLDDKSKRAWEFGIDPLLYRYMEPSKAYFSFDLETVCGLDDTARRLFLPLKKIFKRRPTSPSWNVKDLAVNVLGCKETVPVKNMRDRIKGAAKQLAALGLITAASDIFEGRGSNATVQFNRGDYLELEERQASKPRVTDLPIYELWQTIGVDSEGMAYLYRAHDMGLLQEWADITIAAMEKWGNGFFEKSPAAYYIDNVKKAKADRRAYPDWWHEHRKQELRHKMGYDQFERSQEPAEPTDEEFKQWLGGEGKELYRQTLTTLLEENGNGGRVPENQVKGLVNLARVSVRQRFNQEWSEAASPSLN